MFHDFSCIGVNNCIGVLVRDQDDMFGGFKKLVEGCVRGGLGMGAR